MDTTMLTVLLTLCLTFALLSLVVTVFFPRQSVSRYTAVIFFALYFLTAHFANALEVRTILFFVAGVFLLVVELFIPGFGLAGMAGIGLILVSGALAAPNRFAAWLVLSVALFASGIAVAIFILRGRETIFAQYALTTALTSKRGYTASSSKSALVGETARTVTPLRPAGTIEVGEERYSASAQGTYIAQDEEVEIVRVEGNQIFVRRKA